MFSVNELKIKQQKAIAAAKSILETAEKENRSMSAEENVAFDAAYADADKVSGQIEKVEKVVGIETRSNAARLPNVEEVDTRNTPVWATAEYRSINEKYLRYGKNALNDAEFRALSTGSGTAGGYMVAQEFDNQIREKLVQFNPLRGLCNVIQTTGDRNIPIETNIGDAQFIGETTDIPHADDTGYVNDPTVSRAVLKAYAMKKLVLASRELVQDNIVDMGAYLARNLGKAFGNREYKASMVGVGTTEPTGIVSAADSNHTVTAASATAFTSDEFLDLIDTLPTQYQPGSILVLNQLTRKAIRKMKDGDGRYLWTDGLAGQPNSVLGYPVFTCSYMATPASAAKVIAFFNPQHVTIADRGVREIQTLVETYAETGQIGYLAWQRFDVAVTDADAIAVLTMHS